jgi:hypothetical protein
MGLSELFWTNLYIFGAGFILAVLAILYRSKCSDCNICFGCISFKRDIEVEYREDVRLGLPSTQMGQPQGARRTRPDHAQQLSHETIEQNL